MSYLDRKVEHLLDVVGEQSEERPDGWCQQVWVQGARVLGRGQQGHYHTDHHRHHRAHHRVPQVGKPVQGKDTATQALLI